MAPGSVGSFMSSTTLTLAAGPPSARETAAANDFENRKSVSPFTLNHQITKSACNLLIKSVNKSHNVRSSNRSRKSRQKPSKSNVRWSLMSTGIARTMHTNTMLKKTHKYVTVWFTANMREDINRQGQGTHGDVLVDHCGIRCGRLKRGEILEKLPVPISWVRSQSRGYGTTTLRPLPPSLRNAKLKQHRGWVVRQTQPRPADGPTRARGHCSQHHQSRPDHHLSFPPWAACHWRTPASVKMSSRFTHAQEWDTQGR